MANTKKNKGGRPKKNLDILPEGWQKEILSLYNEGASDVEVRGMIYGWLGSFSDDLWYRWIKEEPEFSRTIEKGRELCRIWWEKIARENLVEISGPGSPKFNSTLWYMNMKNRFGWADKQEVKQTNTNINVELSEEDRKAILKDLDSEL